MIYLSKGLVCKNSTEELLYVTHHGQRFTLTGQLANLWLNGRYGISGTNTLQEEYTLRQLVRMGLAESEETDSAVDRYRILSRCILCPTTKPLKFIVMKETEKMMLTWLHKAGLHLSTAELICLFEKGIELQDELLYERNRQSLVEKLYTQDTIEDGILETQMEHAKRRDEIVEAIQSLIRKKRVVVL